MEKRRSGVRRTDFSVLFLLLAVALASGQVLEYDWTTLLETPATAEFPEKLFEMESGDFVLFGSIQYSWVAASSAMFKFDAHGDTVFSVTFSGKRFDKVIGLSNDRFLAFEWTDSDTAWHAYRISSIGEILWEKKLTQGIWKGFNENFNISEDENGNLKILGVSTDYSLGSYTIMDALADSLLDSLHAATAVIDRAYFLPDGATFPRILGKVNGGYILLAKVFMTSGSNYYLKYDLGKVDSTGRTEWAFRLFPLEFLQETLLTDDLEWFEVLPSGGVSLLLSRIPLGGSYPMGTQWLIISNSGILTLQKSLGQNIIYAYAFPMLNGDYLFIGHSPTRCVLKMDSLGNQLDLKTVAPYSFGFNDRQALLARDSSLVFADVTLPLLFPPDPDGPLPNQDIVLSKLGREAIAVEKGPGQTVAAALSAGPNPFHPSARIQYDTGPAGEGTISLYNQAGRLLFSREVQGSGVFNWNAGNRACGVYVCRLSVGGKTLARKMTLIR